MSIYQVEEYYIHLDRSEIDFSRKDEIAEYIKENHGDDFEFDGDYLTVDEFDSTYSAEDFQDMLKEEFPV